MCGTALIEAPPEQVEERKFVSILFVDLVGFTAHFHDLDPEDVRAALIPYHRLLKPRRNTSAARSRGSSGMRSWRVRAPVALKMMLRGGRVGCFKDH